MAGTGKNVIFSADASVVRPVVEEAIIASGETVLPGHILLKSAGEFISHDAEGNGGKIYIADINYLEQKNVDDALTVGDTVQAFSPRPGEEYNVVVAASQNITALDVGLSSNGDGTLKIAVVTGATPDVVLFYSDEVINTGGATALVRCKVANYGTLATA
jgi:hypothetical protein